VKEYPEVIDLAKYAGISDDQIARDIEDTAREIADLKASEIALRSMEKHAPNDAERRLSGFRADAKPMQIAERVAFIAFLMRIQVAREAAASVPVGDTP
jgi:hypothetical protein